MKSQKLVGALLVSAVASLVASAANADHTKTQKSGGEMYCQNNSCKGQSACKGHGNDSCAGMNSCKGHGFKDASDAQSCKKAGGKWTKEG